MEPEKIKLIHIPEVKSTNLHASALLSGNVYQTPFLIYTNFQLKGKGQGENTWHSEQGKNLLCSIAVEPLKLKIEDNFYLSKLTTLALFSMLNKLLSGLNIKWPNDILVDDKKIGGILIENTLQGAFVKSSIIGIGLNVNQTKFPGFTPPATSMKLLTNNDFKIPGILEELLVNFSKWYSYMENGDTEKIDESYIRHLFRFNQMASFKINDEVVRGKISKVQNNGRIVLDYEDGRKGDFGFKEIAFLQ